MRSPVPFSRRVSYRLSVCLLIALFRTVPGAPLIVAANRDERLDRPAVPMTVLRDAHPRILGGRDELAGGTWLAVNQHGVVAGLTNQPSPGGRDPVKRSRGEIPLKFASYRTASAAVTEVCATLDPAVYNPCWMFVGDRESLYFIEINGAAEIAPVELGPGLHVLENAPLRPRSAKALLVTDLVSHALQKQPEAGPDAAVAALETVLGDHRPARAQDAADAATGRVLPAAVSAACVHADGYGTRSALTVSVPVSGRPGVRVAQGRPCENALHDVSQLWTAAAPAGPAA